MTDRERLVLELAEAWADSWPQPPPQEELVEELALYQAVAAMRARRVPYVPSTPVISEVLEQAATELDRQRREGWHLIDISMVETVDGELVERDYRYLETNAP